MSRIVPTTLVLIAGLMSSACESEDSGPTILLALRSEAPLESLELWSKRYFRDGTVEVLARQDLRLPVGREGYVISEGAEDPLRVRVDVGEPGRFAFHLVGVAAGTGGDARPTLLVATVCRDVTGVVVDSDVYLGILRADLDADGDTFPEDLGAYCRARQSSGLPCELECDQPEYRAMLDCNPERPFVPDADCPLSDIPEPGEDADWNPFVLDACGDCQDRDCYGGDAPCEDRDGDGFPGDRDCDDDDPDINPEAAEICGNGIDENCAPDIPGCADTQDLLCDEDGDGAYAVVTYSACGRDCDDTNPEVNPSAFEGFGSDPDNPDIGYGCGDGVDNNCNGQIDERCNDDLDGDGVVRANDCNDCNSAIGPMFSEDCENGVDEDCDGEDEACPVNDGDGDGVEPDPFGSDCDDADPHAYPGAPDRCGDGVPQNCSLDTTCAEDADGDGFDGTTFDCDDTDPLVNPWGTEVCDDNPDGDPLDEDCDGVVNEVPADQNRTRGCGFDTTADRWVSIDYTSNDEHCGFCHNPCYVEPAFRRGDRCTPMMSPEPGAPVGECICFGSPADEVSCEGGPTDYCCPRADGTGGECRDISADVTSCGDCDTSCIAGSVCKPIGPGGIGRCSCLAEEERIGSEPAPCDPATHNACCEGTGCTNTNTDETNCGGCEPEHDCTAGEHPRGNQCRGGGCVCVSETFGEEVCLGGEWCTELTEPEPCGCRDLLNDQQNCGGCGLACDAGEICVDGGCRCPGSGENCDGTAADTCAPGVGCVNTLTDVAHCGEVFNACAYGDDCVGGVCSCGGGPGCNPGNEQCCGSSCYQTLTDPDHCGPLDDPGACTHACQARVECSGGACACGTGGDCPAGQTCCNGTTCHDLMNDRNNCGECGVVCEDRMVCQSGVCGCRDDADCDDSNTCTEDVCNLSTHQCEYSTKDTDDDGYCDAACPDGASGSPGDCLDGDCNDADGSIYPGATERCSTAADDDCDGDTNDRDAEGCRTFYRDSDDDGYGQSGDSGCYCTARGNYRTETPGDCDDGTDTRNPGLAELCNGIDDDCDVATEDGDDECSHPAGEAGSDYCCGATPRCRNCCTDAQCPGAHNLCQSFNCACEAGWTDCGGDCNCNTGGGDLCCDTTCVPGGECCTASDCGPGDWYCFSNTCSCTGGRVCGGTCVAGAECCDSSDCMETEICCGIFCMPREAC